MKEISSEELRELVENLDTSSDDSRDNLLTNFLKTVYPTPTTQDS